MKKSKDIFTGIGNPKILHLENRTIDKQTLKGAFYKVENDYLGNLPISWFSYSCSNGYYTANMEPVTLKETLEKYLVDAKDISAADRERIQKLADSIHENDNNYILYAKLK